MRQSRRKCQEKVPTKPSQHPITQYMLFDLIAHRKHPKTLAFH